MRVSFETIDDILSHVEINQLTDLYRRTLPLVGMRRFLFKNFLKSTIALEHASVLEKTFNLPFQLKDLGPSTLSTVFNMYLIETIPYDPHYDDFDWEEFKETTLKRMKILRRGGGDIERKLSSVDRKLYRCFG